MDEQEENDLEAERQRQRRYYRRDILITAAVVVIVMIWRSFSGSGNVGLSWDDTSIKAVCPDDIEFTMNFDDINSIEMLAVSDFGDCVSGGENRNTRYGTWKNDQWGEYELYALKSVDECIVMRNADTVLVVNYESDSATAALYEEFQQLSAAPL